MPVAHSEEYKGHTINIHYDDSPHNNPRDGDYCNVGTMVCWHSRYTLGDEQPNCDLDDWLEATLELTDRQIELIHTKVSKQYPDRDSAYWQSYTQELFERFSKDHIVMPLYLYDHSGITMNTGGFSCGWDSGQVGIIYTTKKNAREEYGMKRLNYEKVEEYLTGEVTYYASYLEGQVYGYTVEDSEGNDLDDSCWGFIGCYTDSGILDEAKGAIDYQVRANEAQELADKLAYNKRLKGMIKYHAPLRARMEFVSRGIYDARISYDR